MSAKFVEITHSEVINAINCFNKVKSTAFESMSDDAKIYAAMLVALGVAHQYYFEQLNSMNLIVDEKSTSKEE